MGMGVWVKGIKEYTPISDDEYEENGGYDAAFIEDYIDVPTITNGKYEVIIKVEDIPKDVKYIVAYYA